MVSVSISILNKNTTNPLGGKKYAPIPLNADVGFAGKKVLVDRLSREIIELL